MQDLSPFSQNTTLFTNYFMLVVKLRDVTIKQNLTIDIRYTLKSTQTLSNFALKYYVL